MKSITENEIDDCIKTPSLLVFWASWCGPCIETFYLEEFEKETGIQVFRVNVEENLEVCYQYSINMVPTYIYFYNEPKRLMGLQTKENLINLISKS